MSRFCTFGMVICTILTMALFNACSNDPVSPSGSDVGNVTLSVKGLSSSALAKGVTSPETADKVTVTSATFVIEKIELENKSDRSMDFKFDQPFLQDLMSITTLAEIQTFEVPFGTYDKVKVDIDDLDAQDGDVFTQNVDLQNLSIRIEGFLNEDPSESFVFTSDISINVRLNLTPPLIINDSTANANIVLDFDYGSWFQGENGRFIDPGIPGNQQRIESNIRESFRVFRDDDKDGKKDEHLDIKGQIDSIGENYIIVSETTIFVTDGTKILADSEQDVFFSDLTEGTMVCVRADIRESGELIATKIKVADGEHEDKEDKEDDDDNDDKEDRDFEIEGEIESLGDNFLVISEKQIFVTDDTRIFSAHHDNLSFSELEAGMLVEVHVIERDSGELIAAKIKIEESDNNNDDGNNDNGNGDVFEVKAEITSLGEDFLMIAEKQVFVGEDTKILGASHDEITFADLEAGTLVELRAVTRDDGSLVATKIQIKN